MSEIAYDKHPHTVAMEYVRRADDFSVLRRQIDHHIDRCGGHGWIDRWLTIKAIEDLIDAKIDAALSTPSASERK